MNWTGKGSGTNGALEVTTTTFALLRPRFAQVPEGRSREPAEDLGQGLQIAQDRT